MIEQKFIDKIEDLRLNASSRIDDIQKNSCPMLRSIYMNYQFEYWYEGQKYILWEDDTHLYAVNELPYCYDNYIKNTTFIDTLDHLVAEDKIWPFLLFIDGSAVPWSKITVIHDYDYTYLKIADCKANYSLYTSILVFPIGSKKIRYGEDNDILIGVPDRKGFYFDKAGNRVENVDFADLSIRLEILDSNIYYKEVNIRNLDSGIMKFENLETGFVPRLDNIVVFDYNGKLIPNGAGENFDESFNGTYGYFRVTSNSQTTNAKWAILMYNTSYVKSKSYVYDKSEDLSKKAIEELLLHTKVGTEVWTDVVTPLIEKFDFDHDGQKTYTENLAKATKYITQYDFRLWKDTYMQDFPMKSYRYTGEKFKAMADGKGYVHWSRKHGDFIEDTVLVFVNSKLYKYSLDIIYTTNTVHIPIFGIINDDHVEVVVFTKTNNTILDIVVPDDTTPIKLPDGYEFKDCYLMTDDPHNPEYAVQQSGNYKTWYVVDRWYTDLFDFDGYVIDKKLYFNIEVSVENTTLIVPDAKPSGQLFIHFVDPYYYGKTLKLVPRNQFRFYEAKNKAGESKIVLPTTFQYCHDELRYMVFVNGKKLSRDEYTLTIPGMDRPFDRIILYLSTVLEEGDYVDIYSIPILMEEKYKQDQMTMVGLLDLDEPNNYPKTYPLSKDTTMIFINGLKVNPMEIRDVDLNTVLINVDKYKRDENGNIIIDGQGRKVTNPYYINSIYNVTVMEYLEGSKDAAGYLHGLYEQIPEGQPYDPAKIDFTQSAYDTWKEYITNLVNKYKGGTVELYGTIIQVEGKPLLYFTDEQAEVEIETYKLIADGSEPAYAGLQYIYGTLYPLEEIDPSYKEKFANLRSIVYDAVLEYYIDNQGASAGMPFVYDFETKLWSPIDTTTEVRSIPLYVDQDKMYDYNIMEQNATDEDVIAGQQYIPV